MVQVVEAHVKVEQVYQLFTRLEKYVGYKHFAPAGADGKPNTAFPNNSIMPEHAKYMREALCKACAKDIIKELNALAGLGVDTAGTLEAIAQELKKVEVAG